MEKTIVGLLFPAWEPGVVEGRAPIDTDNTIDILMMFGYYDPITSVNKGRQK
jgi:hypothetical protein